MNRPNPDNYDEVLSIEDYVSDLEKYCDYLEWKIANFEEILYEHQKALDKACALLTYDQLNAIPPKEILNLCMKNWKEFLMKDE